MARRYGQDALSFDMTRVAMLLLLITLIWKKPLLTSFATVLVLIAFFRIISKNTEARRKELAAYEHMTGKVKGAFSLQKQKWTDRKTHRYFKCQCGKVVRVPKGVGKIEIKCPVCGAKFIKKV